MVCPFDVQGGVAWSRTEERKFAEFPCNDAGSFYRVGPLARRQCNEMGEWETADFSSCTLADTASEPFFLLWLVVEADDVSTEEETTLEDEVLTVFVYVIRESVYSM